jgi:long-chain fatty acid transport protein
MQPNSRVPSVVAALLGGLTVLATPARAPANPFEDGFGLGERNRAMGSAATALASDFSAVYYNPAGLSACRHDSVSLGYTRTHHALAISDDEPFTPAEEIAGRNELNIGFCVGLPLRLSFGMQVGLGLTGRMALYQQSIDSRPRWVMHDERLDGLSIMLGPSYRILEGLSVGAAISVLANSGMVLDNTVPAASSHEVQNDLRWDLKPTAALIAGVRYRPVSSLTLGATYRSALYHRLDVDTRTRVEVSGVVVDVGLILEGVMWYTPQQVAAGVAWQPVERLTVAADVTWYDWSAYPGPFIVATPAPDSPVAQTLSFPAREPVAFSDVVVPRVGAELLLADRVALRAGYSFRPTPAPAPRALANLLDADTHVITAGTGVRWQPGAPPESAGAGIEAFSLDGHVAFTIMPERRVDKEGEAAELDSYSFGGFVLDVGVMLSMEY